MAVPIALGAAGTSTLVPPHPLSAATAKFLSPAGKELADLVVSLDASPSPAPTVADVLDDNQVELSDTDGLRPGQTVYWQPAADRALGSPLVVSEVRADDVVVFEAAPPGSFVAGDVIRPLVATAAIPSSLTATLGVNYRIEWACTFDDDIAAIILQDGYQDRTMVNIVLTPFRPAMSPVDCRRYVDENHSSVQRDAGWYRSMAARAAARVERKLIATGRLADLVGDRDLFVDAGVIALRLELAQAGMVPVGHDPQSYRSEQETALNIAVDEAVASVWVDRAQNGDATDKHAVRPLGSVPLRRVS